MFTKVELDERGELPAPYCLEKHNFNAHEIKGDVDEIPNETASSTTGGHGTKAPQIVIKKNEKGKMVDRKGKRVNKKGYLIDERGNILDKHGRKKLDRTQLTSDGDIPRLYNFNARRFDLIDVLGIFDKINGSVVFQKNDQGELIDRLGRKVNEKGYLIDEEGNVINHDGKVIFEQKYLANDGEIPKIFPFSKFNVDNITGEFECDDKGDPILDQKDAQENLVDKKGRKINEKGYLIDEEKNIVNKKGKFMFDNKVLEPTGDIPKLFRTGLLRSDSTSSLSRLMSEIEKTGESDYDDEQLI